MTNSNSKDIRSQRLQKRNFIEYSSTTFRYLRKTPPPCLRKFTKCEDDYLYTFKCNKIIIRNLTEIYILYLCFSSTLTLYRKIIGLSVNTALIRSF